MGFTKPGKHVPPRILWSDIDTIDASRRSKSLHSNSFDVRHQHKVRTQGFSRKATPEICKGANAFHHVPSVQHSFQKKGFTWRVWRLCDAGSIPGQRFTISAPIVSEQRCKGQKGNETNSMAHLENYSGGRLKKSKRYVYMAPSTTSLVWPDYIDT
jgi:hypothetical protein